MNAFFESHSIDLVTLLKMLPAVFGMAGLLTYISRPSKSPSEHEVVNLLAGANRAIVLLACLALIALTLWLFFGSSPTDHDARGIERPVRMAFLAWLPPA
ncbi:MAG TPA: hypothetical protein VME69_07800 [Methylocella sp.]|nr:hypothetical protein [Methylocella sp.]